MSPTDMDSKSMGNNTLSPLSGTGFLVFDVVMLLAVVLPVIAANTVLLVALVLEEESQGSFLASHWWTTLPKFPVPLLYS